LISRLRLIFDWLITEDEKACLFTFFDDHAALLASRAVCMVNKELHILLSKITFQKKIPILKLAGIVFPFEEDSSCF